MRATNKKMWLTSQIHQQILDGKYEICQELSCGEEPKWNFSTEFYGHVPELRQDYIDSTVYAYEALEAARNNIYDEALKAMQEYCKTDVEATEQLCKNTEEKEMSVIITKHGDPNTAKEFKCQNCGCEFTTTDKRYNNTKDSPYTLITACPECNIYVPTAIPTTQVRGRRAAMKPVDEVVVTTEVTYSESEDVLDDETYDEF